MNRNKEPDKLDFGTEDPKNYIFRFKSQESEIDYFTQLFSYKEGLSNSAWKFAKSAFGIGSAALSIRAIEALISNNPLESLAQDKGINFGLDLVGILTIGAASVATAVALIHGYGSYKASLNLGLAKNRYSEESKEEASSQ